MTAPREPPPFSISRRILLAVAGAVLVALLAVAMTLTPSRQGYGTHQQLGLPPCTFKVLFGRRCPSCGMTTSWAHFVRAEPVAAVQANAGGALLAASAMLLAPWLLVSAGRGRWLGPVPTDRAVLSVGGVIVVVTVLDWMFRLLRGS